MTLDASHIAELLLLVLALAAVARRRENWPVAAWVALSVTYSVVTKVWITPALAFAPRPYHGMPRVLLHVGQALYLAAPAMQLVATWRVVGVRGVSMAVPAAVFAAAMFILVDGYAHSPGIGLYRIGPVIFRSDKVYLAVSIIVNCLAWVVAVRRGRAAFSLLSTASEVAAFATMAAVLVVGTLRSALPFSAIARGQPGLTPALMLVAYAIGIGSHLPVISEGLHAYVSRNVRRRLAYRRRAEQLEVVARRLADSEAALADWRAHTHETPDSVDIEKAFPAASDLHERLGRAGDLTRIVLATPRLAEVLEVLAAVLGSLPPRDASTVARECLRTIEESPRKEAAPPERPRDRYVWIGKANGQRLRASPLLSPFMLIALARLHGLTESEALRVLAIIDAAYAELGKLDPVPTATEDLARP